MYGLPLVLHTVSYGMTIYARASGLWHSNMKEAINFSQ